MLMKILNYLSIKIMSQIVNENLYTNNWFNYRNFYTKISEMDFTKFVEVGVWKGHSISFLAKELSRKNKPFELFAVDLWENTPKEDWNKGLYELPFIYEIYETNLINQGVREYIKDIKGNSWESASLFEDNSLDFVFIDAGHEYESVRMDIEKWLPKLKKGGIIAGHDFDNAPGVNKAVQELVNNFELSIDRIWYKNI